MSVTAVASDDGDGDREPRVNPVNELRLVTPDEATYWVDNCNNHNRNVRWEFVGWLADQIKQGLWLLDGNPIRLDYNGQILDGQHRLLACIEANVPIETYVVTGLAPKSQQVMDTGQRRSLGDQLKLNGEKSASQLAATITRIYLTRLGESALRNPSRFRPSVATALHMLEKEPRIRDAVREGGRTAQKIGGTSVSVLSACYYLFSEIDQATADEFFELLRDGTNLGHGDPVLMLRNRLTSNNQQRGDTPAYIVEAWVIKAWNAFREEITVSSISYRAIGVNPEAFPEPL